MIKTLNTCAWTKYYKDSTHTSSRKLACTVCCRGFTQTLQNVKNMCNLTMVGKYSLAIVMLHAVCWVY